MHLLTRLAYAARLRGSLTRLCFGGWGGALGGLTRSLRGAYAELTRAYAELTRAHAELTRAYAELTHPLTRNSMLTRPWPRSGTR